MNVNHLDAHPVVVADVRMSRDSTEFHTTIFQIDQANKTELHQGHIP
ncbi:hypothetical protein [Neorhodopirellula lusitana]